MPELSELYSDKITGAISGWDRIRFRGTIRWLASANGLGAYLGSSRILLKDFGAWANGITKRIRSACAQQAERLGIPVLYLRKAAIDKEALARRIASERGVEVGDICMFSVLEPCNAPLIKGNRSTQKLEIQMGPRKCVFIYHYWNDPVLGFGHTRLQSWLPLSATICINGRHWLERQLISEGLAYRKDGNCFPFLSDISRAQELLDAQLQTNWPSLLQTLLERNCPIVREVFGNHPLDHYWSADETEWATDIIFRIAADLDQIYPSLLRHGLVSADSPAVMRFFGKRVVDGKFRGRPPREILSDHRTRYEGVRLKHWLNGNSIKAYNKAINGFRNRNARDFLYPEAQQSSDKAFQRKLSARVTRRLRLLRAHGLIKKVARTTRYVLTTKGHEVAAAILAASASDIQRLTETAA